MAFFLINRLILFVYSGLTSSVYLSRLETATPFHENLYNVIARSGATKQSPGAGYKPFALSLRSSQ